MKRFYKNFSVAFLTLLIGFSFAGQVWAAANLNFVKKNGGILEDSSVALIVDSSGNIYTTGYFEGTVDFDPGAGTSNLTSNGLDAYISKLDSSGNFVWVKHFSGDGYAFPYSIYLDSSGNIYTTGYFQNTVDFDPGAGTSNLTPAGSDDIYISKLDSSGNFVWVKAIGAGNQDKGVSINVDSNNYVYITGTFQTGPVDFDPGVGTSNLTAGSVDGFILKLDSDGDFVWVKHLQGNSGEVNPASIKIDSSGNIYTVGDFRYTADFDPGAGTTNLNTGGDLNGTFILKLNSSGDFVFVKQIIGVESNSGYSINLDSLGNIYTSGKFRNTTDFDPGAGTTELTSTLNANGYILKLDSSGNFVWVKSFVGEDDDTPVKYIFFDADDDIYATGDFFGTVDFDPGIGISNLISDGDNDIFILKLDPSGDFIWSKKFGGTDQDLIGGLFVDLSSNIYITGGFQDTVDFDPGAGTSNLTSAGSVDAFVLKLSQTSAPTTTTQSASSITTTTATLNGNITDTGGEDNTERGFNIGTDTNYTMTDITESGTYSTGSYSLTATGLTCGTTYHYRAYSTNTAGTGTGSDETFTTSACPVAASTGGSVPVWILQSMSDNLRNTNQSLNESTGQQIQNTNNNQTQKFTFTKNLKYRDRNTDVLELQKFLNNNGFPISKSGIGSKGNETTYFGLATRSALIKYQKANNIKPTEGYFGVITRKFVNSVVQ